jgi:hypothetical protein
MAQPIDPVTAALDVRRGAITLASLPPDLQREVRRLERFNEGKIAGQAARERERPRTFLPGTRTRSARLE